MKLMKKTLVSAAILAGLASANAYAGTKACFEISDGLVSADVWASIYTGAACDYNPAVAGVDAPGTVVDLATSSPVSVAQELTRTLNLAIGDADLGQSAVPYADLGTGAQRQLFFVPTSNIPGGSRFTVELTTNATTSRNGGNAVSFQDDQLYFLLLKENLDGAGNFVSFTLTNVASTDGGVKDQTEITFVIDATTSISAGSRLLITNKSINPQTFSGTRAAALVQADAFLADSGEVNIQMLDDVDCTAPWIKIASTAARTDGGSPILGGVSDAKDVVYSVEQFTGFHLLGGTNPLVSATTPAARGAVDALDPARLTEFDLSYSTSDYVNVGGVDEVHYNKILNNARLDLDLAVVIQNTDSFILKPMSTKDTRAARFVSRDRFGVDGRSAFDPFCFSTTAAGIGAACSATHTTLDTEETLYYRMTEQFLTAGGMQTNTYAMAEAPGATTPYDMARIMGYTYDVTLNWGVEFSATQLKDKALARSCRFDPTSHQIRVNGTQLKVPYVFNTADQIVRIANEHDTTAEVYFDIYGEKGTDATQTENVFVATIPANSAKVFTADELVRLAVAQGYADDKAEGRSDSNLTGQQYQKRHTITFLVTAPSDKVHGFSNQKVPGGLDRQIPVLRNDDEVLENGLVVKPSIWKQ